MDFDDKMSLGIIIVVVIAVLIGIFNAPVRGAFVSIERAQAVAHTQLSPNAELAGRSVWFVNWKGCDKGDVALFRVKPYVSADGQTVNNAIVCAGWPFKGMTVRFK
jgi:hypothetical protein